MSKLSFINCLDAITILKNKKNNVAFIDVRKRKTYVKQFAFGAINCPMDRFAFIIQDLVPDLSTHLLIIGATKKERTKSNSILKKRNLATIIIFKMTTKHGRKLNCLCGLVSILSVRLLASG